VVLLPLHQVYLLHHNLGLVLTVFEGVSNDKRLLGILHGDWCARHSEWERQRVRLTVHIGLHQTVVLECLLVLGWAHLHEDLFVFVVGSLARNDKSSRMAHISGRPKELGRIRRGPKELRRCDLQGPLGWTLAKLNHFLELGLGLL
jgi:hypothetical protein